jgi:hypothetical protein
VSGVGVATGEAARTGPYFQHPTESTLTAQALARVGLSAQPFAALTIDVIRTSTKGKWHVPGDGHDWCQPLNRAYGYRNDARVLPVQPVSLLGEYDFCRWCVHRVTPPGPAGLLYTAARWIVAAAGWVAELEARAGAMTWLDVARWSAQTPFGPPDRVADLLAGLAGARGFARHRLAALGVWKTLRERADAAFATARQAAGPPGLRALAARARDLLAGDTDTRTEAYLIEAIGGVNRRGPWQPDLFTEAVDAWLCGVAADGDPRAGHTAMAAVVEARYGQAPVRDVSLLPDPPLTLYQGQTSPASWATAEYAAVRARLVAGWCTRLGALLHDVPDRDTHRLLLVAGWPITSSRDEELAYLTQYPVVDRAVAACRDPMLAPAPAQVPWVVVLDVPGFAAEHATAHRDGNLHALAGPPTTPGAQPDPSQVRALLRRAAGFLTADTVTDPPALAQVAQWRADAGAGSDLRGWAADGRYAWNLPARWRWVPADDPTGDGPGSLHLLGTLCRALHQHSQPVVARLAAGDPDDLSAIDLIVYPQPGEPTQSAFVYTAHHLPDCPTVHVPLRRLISLSDAQ